MIPIFRGLHILFTFRETTDVLTLYELDVSLTPEHPQRLPQELPHGWDGHETSQPFAWRSPSLCLEGAVSSVRKEILRTGRPSSNPQRRQDLKVLQRRSILGHKDRY